MLPMLRVFEVKHDDVTFLIEEDETGGFVASVPGLPGCLSQGETLDEAVANIEEALALYIEVITERGRPLPEQFRKVRTG
jgi:predicted RNase H-like HicB family nuclease